MAKNKPTDTVKEAPAEAQPQAEAVTSTPEADQPVAGLEALQDGAQSAQADQSPASEPTSDYAANDAAEETQIAQTPVNARREKELADHARHVAQRDEYIRRVRAASEPEVKAPPKPPEVNPHIARRTAAEQAAGRAASEKAAALRAAHPMPGPNPAVDGFNTTVYRPPGFVEDHVKKVAPNLGARPVGA